MKHSYALLPWPIAAIASALALAGCDTESCEKARVDLIAQIETACEAREFMSTPFCAKCVDAGYHSVDDSCTCRVLNFDADFCLYTPGSVHSSRDDGGMRSNSAGTPRVRDALLHATAVCEDREARLPSELPREDDEDAGESR